MGGRTSCTGPASANRSTANICTCRRPLEKRPRCILMRYSSEFYGCTVAFHRCVSHLSLLIMRYSSEFYYYTASFHRYVLHLSLLIIMATSSWSFFFVFPLLLSVVVPLPQP